MRLAIMLIAGIALPTVALCQTFAPKDFDLACAMASTAEMATAPKESDAWNSAFALTSFYLGRLSGRDDRTNWTAVVKGRIAELKEKSKSEDMVNKCVDFYSKKLN